MQVTIDGTAFCASGSSPSLAVEMNEFQPWSPDSPHLYTLRGTYADGKIEARFGMREFTIKDNRFHLNNKPFPLRGVNVGPADRGRFTDTVSAHALVQSLKKTGFNFLRMRGTPAPEALLDAADELGFLICDELDANAGPVEGVVVARRNHPSIVMWHIASATDAGSILKQTHQIDPSRLVVFGLDALDGPAFAMRPYQEDIARIDALTAHLPCAARTERYFEHVGDPNAPVVLVAMGPGIHADTLAGEDIARKLVACELDRVFSSPERLAGAIAAANAEAIAAQVQSARFNPKTAGYCVDGLAAGGSAGLARVQTPMMLAIRAVRANLIPREEVPVAVTLVNDDRTEPLAELSLQVVGPTNQVLWKKKRSLKVPKQPREIWNGTISASGSVGVHKFVVRLMQGMKLLAQNNVELHVVEPAAPCDVEVSVLDPHAEWASRCLALAREPGAKPKLFIVPPLANTVRAYPAEELINILNEVRAGAVALVFGPPEDWNDLASRVDGSLQAESTNAAAAYHYARLHPAFDGLPSSCLMLQPYRNIAPRRTFVDTSDERICGAVFERAAGTLGFGENILVRRFGLGRIALTHLRVLEHLGSDPVADRLYVNLLKHFGRRSVPGEIAQPLHQSVLDWLRRERTERTRLWSLIGPFANWGGAGHDAKYPPEQQVDLAAVHAGWRDPVRWTRWYAVGDLRDEIDFDEALGLPFIGAATNAPETYYAYAECNAPARQTASIRLRTVSGVKIFMNGAVCHESNEPGPDEEIVISVTLKQGKNTLLVKISRERAAARFALSLVSATRDPLAIKWWR